MARALLLRWEDLGRSQLQRNLMSPQKDIQPAWIRSPNARAQHVYVKVPGQLEVGYGEGEMKNMSVAHKSLSATDR